MSDDDSRGTLPAGAAVEHMDDVEAGRRQSEVQLDEPAYVPALDATSGGPDATFGVDSVTSFWAKKRH